MEDIYKDAIALCDKALRTKDIKGITSPREISIETSIETLRDSAFLNNRNIATVPFLDSEGILTIIEGNDQNSEKIDKWMSGFSKKSKEKKALYGYYKVYFNYEVAQKWINNHIKEKVHPMRIAVIIPKERDYIYENKQLHIRMPNNSALSLDFSNSSITEPYFYVMLTLSQETTKHLFSKEEILHKYKQLYKEDLEWNEFTKNVSNIKNKINRSKLSERIILKFERHTNSYRFQILPISSS